MNIDSWRLPARRRVVACVVGTLGLVAPAISGACGACDEDKVAATYDHAVVSRAAAANDVLVYGRIDGRFDGARLNAVTRRIPGVRQASVRISTEFRALSFAVDARRRPAWKTIAAVRHALGPSTSFRVITLVPTPG